MANFDFNRYAVPGSHNGGNARLANAAETDVFPWALCPELVFAQTVTWKDLRDAEDVIQIDDVEVGGTIVAGSHDLAFVDPRTGDTIVTVSYVVHEDTVTIAGTASDGNYDTLFTALDPPVRVRTPRATTPASNANIATQHAADITDRIATDLNGIVASASANSNVVTIIYEAGIAPQTLMCVESTATGTITPSVSDTASDVAAGLEAAIATARATTLADWVDDESVATDTITIEYVEGVQVQLVPDFPGTSTATLVVEAVATIPIGATGDLFPANVWVAGERGAGQNVKTAFVGITTITATLGDAGAANGLMTSATLASTGFTTAPAAAEYAEHMETAFEPIFTVTADAPFASLTAGEVEVLIPYSPPVTI